ncbi:MAG: hypothetical protein AB1567_09520, partial [bacterium]
ERELEEAEWIFRQRLLDIQNKNLENPPSLKARTSNIPRNISPSLINGSCQMQIGLSRYLHLTGRDILPYIAALFGTYFDGYVKKWLHVLAGKESRPDVNLANPVKLAWSLGGYMTTRLKNEAGFSVNGMQAPDMYSRSVPMMRMLQEFLRETSGISLAECWIRGRWVDAVFPQGNLISGRTDIIGVDCKGRGFIIETKKTTTQQNSTPPYHADIRQAMFYATFLNMFLPRYLTDAGINIMATTGIFYLPSGNYFEYPVTPEATNGLKEYIRGRVISLDLLYEARRLRRTLSPLCNTCSYRVPCLSPDRYLDDLIKNDDPAAKDIRLWETLYNGRDNAEKRARELGYSSLYPH